MKDNTFNGWRNWTVWDVALWLDNNREDYEEVRRVCGPQGKDQAGWLAAYVREHFGKTTPDGAQLRHLTQSDWEAIAESFQD